MTAPLRLVANCDDTPRCTLCNDTGEWDNGETSGFCCCLSGQNLYVELALLTDPHDHTPRQAS